MRAALRPLLRARAVLSTTLLVAVPTRCAVRGYAGGAGKVGRPQTRLFVPQPLSGGASIALSEDQRHKLLSVLRLRPGDGVALFNGEDGEWAAEVETLDRRGGAVRVSALQRSQLDQPSPTLLFGVLKGARLPALVEKATELGVGELQPVLTQHCHARDLNLGKLAAAAAAAAEQSARLTVPAIRPPVPLLEALARLERREAPRRLCVCDERGGGIPPLSQVARGLGAGETLDLLVGPEGGFSPAEFEELDGHALVSRVSLGPHTLRSETAVLAALAVLGCR